MSWYLVFTWLDRLKSVSGNSSLERRSQHLPLTNFEGELKLLHEADEDAVIWL